MWRVACRRGRQEVCPALLGGQAPTAADPLTGPKTRPGASVHPDTKQPRNLARRLRPAESGEVLGTRRRPERNALNCLICG